MTLSLDAYRPRDAGAWNAFVATSRNGTFLFDRGFMDYHADRFHDASLIARDGERIVALLPAHRVDDMLVTHGGLSHGGFVLGDACGQRKVMELFGALTQHLAGQGIRTLRYKTVPAPYHRLPTEEDRYALYRLGARPWRCDVLSVIAPGTGAPRSPGRRHALRRALRDSGAQLRTDGCWDAFWPLLEAVLAQRHGVRPVHSLSEIGRLADRFQQQIQLVTAWLGQDLAAGAVLFESGRVIRAQYLATGALGRPLGLLDLVLDVAIRRALDAGKWFDFGASTEQGGAVLNEGLVAFKESFGARTLIHEAYELPIAAP